MTYAQFQAVCPFEIGDSIKIPEKAEVFSLAREGSKTVITDVREHTITDIACIHLARTGTVTFRYELDNSGKYIALVRTEGEGRA